MNIITNQLKRFTLRPFFPLSALLAVLALVLISALIATPNLLRSRMAAQKAGSYATNLSDTYQAAPKIAPSGTSGDLPQTELRKVVQTASLELTVTDLMGAAEKVRLIAQQMGGYVETLNLSQDRDGTHLPPPLSACPPAGWTKPAPRSGNWRPSWKEKGLTPATSPANTWTWRQR